MSLKTAVIFFKLLIFCGCCNNILCDVPYDYYWRDYTGDIPSDAVKGGRDVNNDTTYIGQVFVKNRGIIPVTLYPGQRSVTANINGLHHLSDFISILCSNSKEKLRWVKADAKNLHVQMINKHAVRGGVEHNGVSNIGRISYQGELLVAKVCGFDIGNANLYFPAGDQEKSAETYEILIYENVPNYYWRDYTGDIPNDAVEGGHDKSNRVTYIGQVLVQKYGILPVTIYSGTTAVTASFRGIHQRDKYVKILCSSSKSRFRWIRTNSKNFHTQTINKHVVVGGVESDKVTYIGRISYQGELLVGKVCAFKIGDAVLRFPADNREKSVDSYEVLVYDVPPLS